MMKVKLVDCPKEALALDVTLKTTGNQTRVMDRLLPMSQIASAMMTTVNGEETRVTRDRMMDTRKHIITKQSVLRNRKPKRSDRLHQN